MGVVEEKISEMRRMEETQNRPREKKTDLGHLQVDLLLDSRQHKLNVGVAQARGLPSQHLTGAPDPYVRITIWQFGQVVNQFQTVVKKNTTAPVYDETFDAQVNVKTKALSHTRIVFSVHDRDRLRGDPLLGLVLMGLGATEDSVIEHWDETMVGNGRRVCRWHYIMEKGETQDA
ncbi:synaptotagmin-4-like protein [Elysia marginata]|uniref:Synaptotagmin-4-like protein n=1 Tax=Elysia marginata TaxID=1093978 RepID=A0AAV4K1B7_9GAST|nr:synaptotagmin-4-like protein [Elysia marginata]